MDNQNKQEILKRMEALFFVSQEIARGNSLSASCEKYGVDSEKFLEISNYNIFTTAQNKEDSIDSEIGEVDDLNSDDNCCNDNEVSCGNSVVYFIDKNVDWKEKFMKEIFGKQAVPLPDFDEVFESSMKYLTPKEQRCIIAHFKEELSLKEIGDEFDVSRERVRQILVQAIRKLRHPFRAVLFLKGLQVEEEKKRTEQLAFWKSSRQAMIDKIQQNIDNYKTQLDSLKLQIRECETEYLKFLEEIEVPVISLLGKKEDITIDELDLPVRVNNCLTNAGIHTLNDLCNCSKTDLSKIRNLGRKSFCDLERALNNLGIELKEE